jgi:serine/threonine protein phosphatase PrpC
MAREKTIYVAQDMTEPEWSQRLDGTVVIFSARCPGKTTDNEDAAAVIQSNSGGGVLVVADGMGGGVGGEQASRIAVETVKQEVSVKSNGEKNSLRAAILNGIENANQRILDLGIGAATTLAAVEIQDHTIRPYHVGDSSILVMGQRGKVKLQTVAHSPVGLALEAGVLDDEAAMSHEDRHLVTNILGTTEMRIEIGPTIRLSQYDTVLLATDGLFDNLTIEEIINTVRRGPLSDGFQKLCKEALCRMQEQNADAPNKPDDITIVGFRLA